MRTKKQDRAAAGELLSSTGSAKGGVARAERMDPEQRTRVARAGAFEKQGRLVRVRFTELEHDQRWPKIRGKHICRCLFEVERSGEDVVVGRATVAGLAREWEWENAEEITPTPEWVDRDVLGRAAVGYRRFVIDECVLPPAGISGKFVALTLPLAGTHKIHRTYEFAETEWGWEIIGWR